MPSVTQVEFKQKFLFFIKRHFLLICFLVIFIWLMPKNLNDLGDLVSKIEYGEIQDIKTVFAARCAFRNGKIEQRPREGAGVPMIACVSRKALGDEGKKCYKNADCKGVCHIIAWCDYGECEKMQTETPGKCSSVFFEMAQ